MFHALTQIVLALSLLETFWYIFRGCFWRQFGARGGKATCDNSKKEEEEEREKAKITAPRRLRLRKRGISFLKAFSTPNFFSSSQSLQENLALPHWKGKKFFLAKNIKIQSNIVLEVEAAFSFLFVWGRRDSSSAVAS